MDTMKTKRGLIFFVGLATSVVMAAQGSAVPLFFDGFEETGGSDALFDHWTTENKQGWHYWHILPGGGNPGQCMRFEASNIDQDDWLITHSIDCSSVSSSKLTITFDGYYTGSGDKFLAFHYQAAANQGLYFLLDNVCVKEYKPTTTYN